MFPSGVIKNEKKNVYKKVSLTDITIGEQS